MPTDQPADLQPDDRGRRDAVPLHRRRGRPGTPTPPTPDRRERTIYSTQRLPAVPGRPRRPAAQRRHDRRGAARTPPTATASRSAVRRRLNSGTTTGKFGTATQSRTTRPHSTTRSARSTTSRTEPWDYFPFNDRDFTSVAELMLVPGCPPGLFTKQFVELAPMPPSTTASRLAITFPVPSTMPLNPTPRRTAAAGATRPPTGLARRRVGVPTAATSTPPSRTRIPTWWTSSSTPATAARPGSPGHRTHARPGRRGRRHRSGRLVQDVRVLRGAQPDDRRDRPGGHRGPTSTGPGRTPSPDCSTST